MSGGIDDDGMCIERFSGIGGFFQKILSFVIDVNMNYEMHLEKNFTISIIAITNLPVGMLLLRYAHRILLIILWNE